MTTGTLHVEEHAVRGKMLVAKARALVKEGNARRIIVKNHEGVVLLEVPLTVGLVGAVLEPVWVALGAIAALAAHYRIAVERGDTAAAPAPEAAAEPALRPQPEPSFHGRSDV